MASQPPLLARCVSEAIGTFILVFFGLGAVHAAVLTGAQAGIWQVAIVWGVAATVAIYVVGAISGAHINPAMTLMFVVCRRFPLPSALAYIPAQVAGAFVAAACVYAMFDPFLRGLETTLNVSRGDPGSVFTAMCYGEYYPNPGVLEARDKFRYELDGTQRQKDLAEHMSMVKEATAIFAEFLGTLFLGLVVMAVTDPRNRAAPLWRMAPWFIGLTVAGLISVLAPVTQACLNPARDFGPRFFACWVGWGDVAIPGPNGRGFWTVYIVAPIAGALVGGCMYTLFVRPFLPEGEATGE